MRRILRSIDGPARIIVLVGIILLYAKIFLHPPGGKGDLRQSAALVETAP